MRPALVFLFAVSAAPAFAAAKPAVKEGDGFRLTLAPTWAPLLDVEKAIGDALPPDVTGGVLAWGDSAAGAALQVMWIQSKEPSTKPVREELESFHATLRTFLEDSGSKTKDFQLTERDNRLTSRHLFESEASHTSTLNLSSAGVPKDGRTRSWSAQCVWATPRGKSACDTAMASFKVTVPAKSLQALPAKPKPKEKTK